MKFSLYRMFNNIFVTYLSGYRYIILDPPGNVRIIPDKETFYTKDHGTPYEDVVCQADCLPSCTYVWYRDSSRLSRNYEYSFTIGNSLFATKQFTDSIFRYFSCKASNSFGSSKSRWIKMELKGRFTSFLFV